MKKHVEVLNEVPKEKIGFILQSFLFDGADKVEVESDADHKFYDVTATWNNWLKRT